MKIALDATGTSNAVAIQRKSAHKVLSQSQHAPKPIYSLRNK